MKRDNRISVFLLTLFVIILMTDITSFAQSTEFKVVSFKHDGNSLLARLNKRLDDNDEPCALIQVRTAEEGVRFTASSGIVGNVEWKNGDYWVYVSGGNRSLKVFKQGIKTTEYIFIPIPKSLEAYILELDVIRPAPNMTEWPVTIITKPENAILTIDGKTIDRQSKTVQITEGEHTLILEMQGYKKLEKSVIVNKNNVYFNFELNEISNVALMLETVPEGATVYLDEIKVGETPVSAFYPPGTYNIRIIKEGYLTVENQTLTVAPPQTKESFTLEENVGYITINTFETAKVYINGTEYPEHQNIKLTPQLLTIRVEMPKAEPIEKQVVLKRKDQLTEEIFPYVVTGTVQVAVTPFDATIELTGDAGEQYTYDGMHIFRDIPVGQYTLTAKAEGYATKTETFILTANGVIDKSIKLEKGPSGEIEMVFVKGGTFTMGCTSEQSDCDSDEKPPHKVTVSDFYIGKYEVTQKQWSEIMGASASLSSPSHFKNCDDCPVENVSWNDVQEFIKKLNEKTGLHYRLPTEAEWEYAARGGVETHGHASLHQYAGSNNIDNVAWYWKNSGDNQLYGGWYLNRIKNNNCKIHPVGQKQPNELGIYDMSGNVWEWCSDWYGKDYYKNSPDNNPQGSSSGTSRVARGGSWYGNARVCRMADRSNGNPSFRYYYIGFRLVLVP